MSRLAIRMTIVLVSVYLIACYIVADIFAVDIWRQFYFLPFEMCVCLCISKQGVYHCKYIKWTAYALLLHDTLVCSDVLWDWLPDGMMAVVPPTILTMGIAIPLALAIRHYMQARKVMRLLEQWKRIKMPSRK